MEDKKNKPVPEKNTKKPTGKSATGKPLDGIDINPQLDDKRRTNEDFAVLTATLQERKALTLAQRQQRGRQLKRIQPKIQRAKEISQARLAGPEKLQRRAEAKARGILKSRISARKDIPYAELTTSEKIQVDTAVAKKTKLIKRIAARLLPKLRKAEFERLKSFHSGAPIKSLHTVTASEDFSGLFNDLNAKSTLELVDIIENAIAKFEKESNPISITLRRMLNSTVGTDPITETLIKKAEKTGMPFSTLKEVFERGLSLYVNESNQTPEQVAFNRVNSYISKGRAWNLDADLREEKIINEQLDTAFNDLLEKSGLWANIHAKRQRIKAGSGERMRKPGEKGAPTPAGLKSAQEAACEIVDRRPVTLKSKRRQQEVQKKIIDESNNTPYVKPFTEKGSTTQRGWKASNKHGNVKYFGMDFKASAHKHAGISEAADKHPIAKEYDSLKKHDIKTLRGLVKQQSKVVDTSEFKTKDHAISHYLRNKHGNKKVDTAFGFKEDTASDREIGTNSLAKKYKKDTPCQKSNLDENFNMAWTAGIGVTLSAEECGIRMKPAFELHPDVVDAMEEVRSSDVEGVIVRTADGKTVVRKQKRNKKIIGTGNLTDGKPDDTV
jgi:hypothetical protein